MSDKKDKYSPLRQAIAPALICAAVFAALWASSPLWSPLEQRAYDARMRLIESIGASSASPTGKVVVVGMEEDRIAAVKPLIFWYPEIGRFLSLMDSHGANAVGIDLIPLHSLGQKMKDAAISIMADNARAGFEDEMEELGELTDNSLMAPMLRSTERMGLVQGVADGTVPYYYSFMAFMKNAHPATVRLTPDSDAVLRSQAMRIGGDEAFAHALARLAAPESPLPEGSVLLNYHLQKGIPYYSFLDVLDGKAPAGSFEGRTVLLGYITRYDDVHMTPWGREIPGVMIHAIALETLLDRSRPMPAPVWASIMALGLLCALSALFSARFGPTLAIALNLIVIAISATSNLWLYQSGILMPLAPHLFAPIIIFGTIYPYRYFIEERSRRRIIKTFSYYMDPRIIDSLMDKDAESLMKGEIKDFCMLFSDIRGFTSMTNQNTPEMVIGFLNQYFRLVTEIIQHNNGVVDKFIGDAVLAYFPHEGNPCVNAIAASKQMLEAAEEFNKSDLVRSLRGGWTLQIGIGLDYGSAIIGNIGSERRMDFTVIGDPVNKASRMEGITKRLKVPIVTTEIVFFMAKEQFEFRHLGLYGVRGVGEHIDLYTIMY